MIVMASSTFVYDKPRLSEINSFLNYIYDIKRYNKDLEITENIVYHELCRYALSASDKDSEGFGKSNEEMFEKWAERFQNVRNIKAFCSEDWKYFFQFVNWNSNEEDEYIKLYIPLKLDHLYEGANILFDYLSSENIQHCSKISKKTRSDNVIIRLQKDDYPNAMKIINFIKTHPYFQDGLNKTNPFVPNVMGIGIMKESGISYNLEMSKRIANYIEYCYKNDINYINVASFSSWMQTRCSDLEVYKIYGTAVGNDTSSLNLTGEQQISLIMDSLIATNNKYGYKQAVCALNSAMNGDYSYFTNGSRKSVNYRDLLRKGVDKEVFRILVYSTLEKLNKKNCSNLSKEEASDLYCRFLFSNDLAIKLDNACKVTIENYGEKQCVCGIKKYLLSGSASMFSRYSHKDDEDDKINYRNIISTFNSSGMIEAMEKSLLLKGVKQSYRTISELAEIYSSELRKSMYENIDEFSQKGKL